MKAFLSQQTHKRKASRSRSRSPSTSAGSLFPQEEDSTEVKLALLSSLYPHLGQDVLLDVLLASDGSVARASESLASDQASPRKSIRRGVIGHQGSLRSFTLSDGSSPSVSKKLRSKKGSTLHLYDPSDVAEHTPCTIIHNFLPTELANELLKEMLGEAVTFERNTFKLFDNVVSSPHTSSFFVESYDEIRQQKTEYLYNGSTLTVSVCRAKP